MKKKYLLSFLLLSFCAHYSIAQQLELKQQLEVPIFAPDSYDAIDEIAQIAGDQAIFADRARNGAYIFEKDNAGNWALGATLKGSEATEEFDRVKVSLTQDRAIITSSGNAYIFEKLDGTWTETKKVPLVEGHHAIAIAGDFAMIGNSYVNDRSGNVWVYQKTTSGWTKVQTLVNEDNYIGDSFGYRIALKQDRVIIQTMIFDFISERPETENDQPLYVFDYAEGEWQQTAKIEGITCSFDGCSTPTIDLDGDRIITAEPDFSADAAGGYLSGNIDVLSLQGGKWNFTDYFKASDETLNDYFGISISISGDIITSLTAEKGSYIYHYENGNWEEIQILRNYSIVDYAEGTAIAYGPEENTVYFLESTEASQVPTITSLSLVNADNNQVISPFRGGALDLRYLNGRNYNIVANTKDVGSMTFELRSVGDYVGDEKQYFKKTEQYAPFALFGDDHGTFRNWQPEESGHYTLVAIPYAGKDLRGAVGEPYTVEFVVKEKKYATGGKNPFTKFDKYQNDSLQLILVNADDNTYIQHLHEGDVINLQERSNENYSILALLPEDAYTNSSVYFELNLPNSLYARRKESKAPYAIFGDNRAGFRNWQPELGKYALSVRSSGVDTKTIHFEIIDKQPATAFMNEVSVAALSIYPNPAVSEVKAAIETDAAYSIKVLNSYGKEIYQFRGTGKMEKIISLNNQKPGIYLVILETNDEKSTQRLIIR